MPVKPVRPCLTRRSIIAAASGLAFTGCWGKFAAAQLTEGDLPDAADLLDKIMPQAAPPIRFTNVQGRALSLKDYAGHALVVNLWATWCGPCVAELPSFAAIAPSLKASNVLFLPISIDMQGAAVVQSFYASHAIHTLPILLDPNGNNMQVLNTDGIPVTILINAAGQMVARLDSAANWNTKRMLKYLRSLGSAPTPGATDGFIPV